MNDELVFRIALIGFVVISIGIMFYGFMKYESSYTQKQVIVDKCNEVIIKCNKQMEINKERIMNLTIKNISSRYIITSYMYR